MNDHVNGFLVRPFAILAFAAFAALRVLASESTVLFYGGAGHVGGSCALVEKDGFRVLVDCGASYGEETSSKGRVKNPEGFGFDPQSVSNVVITHAHQDHAGRLPDLVRAGFRGTIWMTPPTLSILSVVWKMRVKYEDAPHDWKWSERRNGKSRVVHWRDACRSAGKINDRNSHAFTGSFREVERHVRARTREDTWVFPCHECDALELEETLRHVRTVGFGEPFGVGPFTVCLRPVRHLPGAAAVYFSDGCASWCFSGDLGTRRSSLVEKIEPAEKVDAIFVETTSGDSGYGERTTAEEERRRFRRVVGERVKGGGLAWIPAFALDRSQRILVEIQACMDEGLVPTNTPLYYLSPSSREIAKAYFDHPEWFETKVLSGVAGLFDRSIRQFRSEEYRGGGGILLSTSGMMDAGASYAMIPDLVPRDDVTVCFVGYQAAGTPGSKLRRGAKSLRMTDGKKVKVGCRVESFGCFSGHAEGKEVDEWLENNRQSKIYLVHGDGERLAKRKAGMEERFKADVEIAKTGKKYIIKSNGLVGCAARSSPRTD